MKADEITILMIPDVSHFYQDESPIEDREIADEMRIL